MNGPSLSPNNPNKLSIIPDFLSSLTRFVEDNQFDIDKYREGGDLLLFLWCFERLEKVIKTGPSPPLNKLSTIPDFMSHLSSLTHSLQDSFVKDHLCLGEDCDESDNGEEYNDDQSGESYIEDDEEWLTDFMEDPFYESCKYSDEEAAEILGLPSNGMKCDGEDICGICLDPLEECYGYMKELPCKHIYHYRCIQESTKFKNSCPTCRGKFDYRGKDKCEKVDRDLYFQMWKIEDIHRMWFFDDHECETFDRKVVPPPPTWLNLNLGLFEQIFDREVVSPPPTLLNLDLGFFEAEMINVECDYKRYDIWGRKEVPLKCFELYFSKSEMEEVFALFDEGAKGSASLGQRKEIDGKKEYGTWHMKPLACKEKYDYKCILGSTKIRSMGNMSAGRKMMNRIFSTNNPIL